MRHHRHTHHDDERFSLWLGRHGGGRGLRGLRTGWPGGAGFGRGGFRIGRKLGSDDLQLVILALLAEQPRHGYELIKVLEERSGGFYSPSPGMVYPALTYLEEIGHATVAAEGAKKLYSVTAEGRAYLEQHRALVDGVLSELERIGGRMHDVRRVFAGASAAESDEDGGPQSPQDLRRARRELRRALHDKADCSPDEANRIAAILRRATADILREN
jgi:DNA-binding PadR family transcriptional regulator